MADAKISALTNLTAADAINDMIPIVDVSDTPPASGNTKRISINNLLSSSPTASGALTVTGLVTAGSATITGAATVGTTLGVTGVSTFAAGTALLPALTTTGDTNTGIYYPAADTFAVTTGGAERYRVDSSGNVGVGLTPRVKLDVNGGLLVNNYTTSTNYAPLSVTTASTITTPSTFTNAINIWNPTTVGAYSNITFGYNALGLTNAPAYIGFVSTTSTSGGFGDLVFGTRNVGTDTAATERMRIDSSGNVGIGVTPSAWDTNYKALQLGFPNFIAGNNGGNIIDIGVNAYFNTDWKYAASSVAATRYRQVVGVHQWYTAPSGTAGNAITFTQAMTLDASGNLLVGTTTNTNSSRVFARGTGGATTLAIQSSIGDTANPGLLVGKFDNDSTTSQILVRFTINNNASGSGQITANGANAAAFGTFSDSRLKENITSIPSQLAKILSLRPVEFDFKNGSGHQIGFVAQEMQEVYPDVVGEQDGFLTVTGWSKTEARLVSAIKELAAKVQALEAKLA